jgi:hypothetical protein
MASKYITIGSTNIRRSNIKSFGVSSRTEQPILGEKARTGRSELFFQGPEFIMGEPKTVMYVYVATYQNDNYVFTEDEVNITEVIEMLKNDE